MSRMAQIPCDSQVLARRFHGPARARSLASLTSIDKAMIRGSAGQLEFIAPKPGSHFASSRRQLILVAGIVCGLLFGVAAIYGQALGFQRITYDDGLFVYNNPVVAPV